MKLHYMILKWKKGDTKVAALSLAEGKKAAWVPVADARASHWKDSDAAMKVLDRLIKVGATDVRSVHVANPKTFTAADVPLIAGK